MFSDFYVKVKMLAVVLVLALVVSASGEKRALFKQQKPRTAEGAIACGLKYGDIDKDGAISVAEFKVIRDLALGPIEAPLVHLAEKASLLPHRLSVAKVFEDCDFDKDGIITMQDFQKMRATCLETQGKVDDMYHYICKKGTEGVFDHAKL